MIWDSKDSELRGRLLAKLYLTQRPHLYKTLAIWLDVYTYIFPNDRSDGPQVNIKITGHHQAFLLWEFLDILHTSCTYNEQENIWKLINESSISPIQVSLHSTHAQENSSSTNLTAKQILNNLSRQLNL